MITPPHDSTGAAMTRTHTVATPDATREAPVLSVRSLRKTFTLHARARTIHAVEGVSFDCAPGSFTALFGNSGAGKSSILKCVYRTYLADGGEILYRTAEGPIVDLATADEQVILALRDRELGVVTQFLAVLPRQTALEVVAAPLRRLGVARDEALDAAAQRLRAIGLPDRLWDVEPATFSGGERQIVNLARALVVAPRLLLLDEPTASLDARAADAVIDAIERMRDGGVTIVGVFHNRAAVDRLADAVVRVEGGILTGG